MKKLPGFTLVELMAVLAILFWMVVTGGVIWVAVHFISKFW